MLKVKAIFNRNLKLAFILKNKGKEKVTTYRLDTSTSVTVSSTAETPTQSNVPIGIRNVGFKVSNDSGYDDAEATKTEAEILQEQNDESNFLPAEMQYIGIEVWAEANVEAERLYKA
eukprot:3791146-Ditylum_brightwellii.AAC.1